ncbi:coil containing protein [Vibrio phage vB_VcM_SY]
MDNEWNGKGLPPVDVECEWIGGGVAHGDWGLVAVRAYSGDYAWIEKLYDNSMHTVRSPAFFRKLETPQQREEREQLEAAYDLYCEWHKLLGHNSIRHISAFNEDDNYAIFRFFIARQKNTI